MYTYLLEFHKYWAFLVIILSIVLLVLAIQQLISKNEPSALIKKISFFTVMVYHIQFVAGLLLLLFSSDLPLVIQEGKLMSEAAYRFKFVEHPLMMISAVIFITLFNAKLKRSSVLSTGIFIMLLLALICMFIRIPETLFQFN